MSAVTIDVEIDGRRRRVAVERAGADPTRFRISWGGVTRVVDACAIDLETLSLVVVEGGAGSHQVRCVDAGEDGALDLHVGGAVVRARVGGDRARLTRRAARGAVAAGGRRISAPMPGKVVRLLVGPGDEVAARQGVVVVEAMKMENELAAPRAGRVARVAVAEGDSVEAGKVLVEIE